MTGNRYVNIPSLVILCFVMLGGQGGAEPRGGTLRDGVYHHHGTGVRFTVPDQWTLGRLSRADGGDVVTLRDAVSGAELHVWMREDRTPPDCLDAALDDAVAEKLRDRATHHVPANAIGRMTVNGRDAVRAVRLVARDGQPMVEDMTWIYTANTRVLFSVVSPVSQLPAVRARTTPIIDSAVIR